MHSAPSTAEGQVVVAWSNPWRCPTAMEGVEVGRSQVSSCFPRAPHLLPLLEGLVVLPRGDSDVAEGHVTAVGQVAPWPLPTPSLFWSQLVPPSLSRCRPLDKGCGRDPSSLESLMLPHVAVQPPEHTCTHASPCLGSYSTCVWMRTHAHVCEEASTLNTRSCLSAPRPCRPPHPSL